MLQYKPAAQRAIASTFLAGRGEKLFVTRSVKELLWGYTDPVLTALKALLPSGLVPTDFVGYFINVGGR